jgi:hypothetical protein
MSSPKGDLIVMQPASSVSRAASILKWSATIALLLLSGAVVFMLASPSAVGEAIRTHLHNTDWAELAAWQRWSAKAVSVIPALLFAAALWQVRKFAGLYMAGDPFPAGAGAHIKKFGYLLLALAVAQILTGIALSVLLSIHMPAGQRMLAIGISSTNVATLVIAALVMMIARLLDEAFSVAEDNRSIV